MNHHHYLHEILQNVCQLKVYLHACFAIIRMYIKVHNIDIIFNFKLRL